MLRSLFGSIFLFILLLTAFSGSSVFGQQPSQNLVVIPRYPSLAKITHTEGTIAIQIEVGPSGLIRLLKVEDHDKKLSALAYVVVTSVSKWRLVSQANQQLRMAFTFQLLPHNCKDDELETKLDLFSEIKIQERMLPPTENSPIIDPPQIK